MIKKLISPLLASIFLASGVCAEEKSAMVTSTTLLTSGKSMGVGGGPQGNSSVVGVCEVSKINEDEIGDATASALDALGISLDPPTTNPFEVVSIGNEWHTRPSKIKATELAAYNAQTEAPLVNKYPFYVSYDASLFLRGRALRLQTITTLRKGLNANESEPYRGDFDPKFFHGMLLNKILEQLTERGCGK